MTEHTPRGLYRGRAGQLRRRIPPWMLDRQVLHIPAGLAVSWLLFLAPFDPTASLLVGARIAAALVFFGFIAYEVTEDWKSNDWAFRDIEGFTIGLGGGSAAQVLLNLLEVY